MSFGVPLLLLTLAAAPVALALASLLWRRRRRHLLALRQLGGGIISPSNARRGAGWRLLALTIVLLLLALAAARPQFGADESALEQPPLGVVIALDVSLSMSATDVAPSRFAAALAEVRRLVDAQRALRIGLVIFAGEPFVRFPLTLDHASALAVLGALQPGESLVPPGSNIAAAIETSLDLLQRADAAEGAIVVVSDGETHEGEAAAAARAAADAGARVFAAGVGAELGAPIPAPGRAEDEYRIDARTGREVLSRLEQAALQAIAAAGGGRYLRIDAPGALSSLSADFAAIGRARSDGERSAAPREQYQWFAAAALALLVGGSLLQLAAASGLAVRARRMLAPAALIALAALIAASLAACAGSRAEQANRDGNAHFAAGRYADALESWREAQRRAPDEPVIALNVGRALHALGEFERAETATLAAMRSDDRQIRALALFHTGNHRWAGGDLLGARAAFVEALRARPNLLDAKINLELVNRLLADLLIDQSAPAGPEASPNAPQAEASQSAGGDPAEPDAESSSGEPNDQSGPTQGAGSDGNTGPGADAAAETAAPTFAENDRVAQREAAQDALRDALDNLPLEQASPEQAMAVLDALRAVPDERFATDPAATPLEGVNDW